LSGSHEDREDRINLYTMIPRDLNAALDAKSRRMGASKQILVRAILEAWMVHYGAKDIGIGEIDRTIVP
jgi:hypothetical protein